MLFKRAYDQGSLDAKRSVGMSDAEIKSFMSKINPMRRDSMGNSADMTKSDIEKGSPINKWK